MAAPFLPAGPEPDFQPTGLLQTLLTLSLTAVAVLRPVCAEDGETIADFALRYLNPAGQLLLGLPEHPGASVRTLLSEGQPVGSFAHYCEAFRTGQPTRYEAGYQQDGLAGCLLTVAQRHDDLLVVNFTTTSDQSHSGGEGGLRASQAREQAALAEARRQQQRLRQVFEHAPMPLALLHGPDHVVELAYPALAGLWGRSLAQVLGRPVFQALPDVRDQGFEELLAGVLRTGQPFQARELPVVLDRAHLGQPALGYFDLTYQALYDAPGGPATGLIASAVEVTGQVQARQRVEQLNHELEARVHERTQQALALQANLLTAAQARAQERELFYQVFAQTPAAVAILRGPAHRFDYVNPAYQHFFGAAPLVGRTVAEVTAGTENTQYLDLLDEVYRTGQVQRGYEAPVQLTSPAGAPRQAYFNFTYSPYQVDGQPVGICIFAYEVTAQVLARREREAQQAELQGLFEHAPVAICVYRGSDYVVELANSTLLAILGVEAAQMLHRPLAAFMPDIERQGLQAALDGVRQTGMPFVAQEMPLTLPFRPGREHGYFNFSYQPLPDAQGEISGILCVATEVTEQVLARQQVEQLNQQLTATNDKLLATNAQLTRTNVDLDTFVYTASHDLKVPIANVEGIIQALRATLPPQVQQEEVIAHLLDLLDQNTARFQLTISQLTDLSKLQLVHAGPPEPVVLAAVVEDLRLDLAPALTAAAAQLTVEVAPELVVSFAPANLRSILYNLLSNAVKYHAPDRPAQVFVRAARAGQVVEVQVQDNGLGLNTHQRERLFGLFQRLHTHVEGTGVGLYITKRLVENSGGTIAVVSQVGVGTTFTLTFPV